MNALRRWQLGQASPYSLVIAADARLSQTDFAEDQVWELRFGTGDLPALSVQTAFGGRVNAVSLIPLITLYSPNPQTLYQAEHYAQAPQLQHFSTQYAHASAQVTPTLALQAQVMAFESHAIGGIYRLHNQSDQALSLRFELFGYAQARSEAETKLAIVTLAEDGKALSLGLFPSLAPIAVLEGGSSDFTSAAPRIGVTLSLAPHAQHELRWTCAARPQQNESFILAHRWLAQAWAPILSSIQRSASALPEFETGDDALDAVLASSVQRIPQAFFNPYGKLAQPSFVGLRMPEHGYSKKGDASDGIRAWAGQDPYASYLIAPVLASIHPPFARAILENYLSVQEADGKIDYRPGVAGQRVGYACPPLLASLLWRIEQISPDSDLLQRSFNPLLRFLRYWLTCDADGDGIPEWQDERQLGIIAYPSFGINHAWGQGLDIRAVESPDLLALLLQEISSLHAIAERIHAEASVMAELDRLHQALMQGLDRAWQGTHYATLDSEGHHSNPQQWLLSEGAGDAEHFIKTRLDQPSHIVVHIVGGAQLSPNLVCHIEGIGRDGTALRLSLDKRAFSWQGRRGVATTPQAFAQVDRIVCENLSRVYRISAFAPDLSRLDIRAFVPLCLPNLAPERAQALIQHLTQPQHFWRSNGISSVSAQDSAFDPANAEGGGGIWLFWNALLGEALLQAGASKEANALMRAILNLQSRVLARTQRFGQFYHADADHASGELDHLLGIAPMDFFLRLIGVRILDSARVAVTGALAWNKTLVYRQHGITLKRTTKSLQIKFASGTVIKLNEPISAQIIQDDKAQASPAIVPIRLPELNRQTPSKSAPKASGTPKTRIPLERDE